MKTVMIIQARMGSARLPGKVLADLAGGPLLARCVERAKRAYLIDETVIATTENRKDDAIERLCKQHGWACFRGAEEDVLDRYQQAAAKHQADVVVRVTSDCPLIDPDMIDRAIISFSDSRPKADYVSNFWPRRSFPRGLDVEVFSVETLARAWRMDRNPALREHVTEYVLRHPELFRLKGIQMRRGFAWHRWTVDTADDLELVRRIYAHFGNDRFTWRDVLKAFGEHPEWAEINAHVQQKQVV